MIRAISRHVWETHLMREWDRQRFALSITARFLSNFVYAKSVSTIALSLVPVHAYRHDIYFIGVVHETQATSMLQSDPNPTKAF